MLMNVKNAKIGERYHVYLDADKKMIATSPTENTIPATIIAVTTDTVLFGWKPDEVHPANAKERTGNLSSMYKYGADQSKFNYSLSMKRDGIVKSRILAPGEYDGCRCTKCGNFYPYAEPNQEDGTLICYSCRMSW